MKLLLPLDLLGSLVFHCHLAHEQQMSPKATMYSWATNYSEVLI
jgi:hypothetical protein